MVGKLEGVLEQVTHRGGEQIAISINGEAGIHRRNTQPAFLDLRFEGSGHLDLADEIRQRE